MKAPSHLLRNSVIGLAIVLTVALCTWLWFEVMEQVWEPQRRLGVKLAGKPMLAATRLLERRGYQVDVYPLLGDANLDALPDGTLILADNHGRMSDIQARQLLAWVRRGNTLVAQPRWSGDMDVDPAGKHRGDKRILRRLDEPDPLGAHAGVTMTFVHKVRDHCGAAMAPQQASPAAPDGGDSGDGDDGNVPADNGGNEDGDEEEEDDDAAGERQFTCVTPPGGRHPLVLEMTHEVIVPLAHARPALWGDPDGEAVRVLEEGRGKLVMVSDNFFNNGRLPRYDHAELLLALAALQPNAKHAFIVQDLNAVPWYAALWRAGGMALSALAVLAVLLLWRAAIGGRFGPRLQEPATARRALLEHVEASGNWLWKARGGRALLLAAARRETLALLARRAPELRQLEGHALCARLARLHGLDESALQEALYGEAGAQPSAFTRQIRLLQQVRTSYEHSERQ